MFGIFEVFADTIVICTLTAMVILCSGTTVNYGTAAGAADDLRLYHDLRRLGIHLHGGGTVLLCLPPSSAGVVRLTLYCIPLPQRQGRAPLLRGVLLRFHPGCYDGPGPDVEHCGDVQWPHGNPKPDRSAVAFRHSGAADKGIF